MRTMGSGGAKWLAMLCLGLAACANQNDSGDIAGTRHTPSPGPGGTPTAAMMTASSSGKTSLAFPTGDRATSVLAVDRIAPTEWSAGQTYDYELQVTNLTGVALSEVVLAERMPAGLRMTGATPTPTNRGEGEVRWALGTLGPRETKSVRVRGVASAPAATVAGGESDCISVTYVPWACLPFQVVKPDLQIVATAPEEILRCEPIPVKYTVTNRGTGTARNLVIRHALPKGMQPESGAAEQLEAKVEALGAGESRSFVANVRALKPGRYVNSIAVAADAGLNASTTTTTNVREPVLAIKKTGPATLFLGRDFTYEITVTNTGDGAARDTVVEDTLPTNATLVSATAGGTNAAGKLAWSLGTLQPKDSKRVSVTLRVEQASSVVNSATARAQCAAEVSSTVQTTVRGVPAILLEVVDDPDPIPVGSNVTYTIRVTNQGSATATNITIACDLEDTMQFVSASGQTSGGATGKTVNFAALKSLAPKAVAEWKVVVKAVSAGDVRFGVKMQSDQLERPVTETEATNFYQ